MLSWSVHFVVALALLPAVDGAFLRDRPIAELRELHASSNNVPEEGNKDHSYAFKVAVHSAKPLGSRARSILLQLAQLCTGSHVQNFLRHRLGQENIQDDKDSEPSGSEQLPAFVLAPDVVVADPTAAQQWYDAWLQALLFRLFLLGYVALVCVVAYLYFRQKPVREDVMPELEDWDDLNEWKYGICDCCSAPGICLWAWCCPAIRWADTLGMTGLLGFWLAFAIYLGVDYVGGIAGELLFWILLAVICAGFRQEMRIKFNMKKQGGATYVQDCLLYCCCTVCVMTQEARQVEDACSKVGGPVQVVPAVPVNDTT